MSQEVASSTMDAASEWTPAHTRVNQLSHEERSFGTVPGTIRRGTMGPAERTWVVTRDKTAKRDRD